MRVDYPTRQSRQFILDSPVLELTSTRPGTSRPARTRLPVPWLRRFVGTKSVGFILRCELDAAFFHLYLPSDTNWRIGDSSASEAESLKPALRDTFPSRVRLVAYIMDAFPIVSRKDWSEVARPNEARHSRNLRRDTTKQSRTGQPYQTRWRPPPADPRVPSPEDGDRNPRLRFPDHDPGPQTRGQDHHASQNTDSFPSRIPADTAADNERRRTNAGTTLRW